MDWIERHIALGSDGLQLRLKVEVVREFQVLFSDVLYCEQASA